MKLKLDAHIAAMAPHQLKRRAGKLLIEARERIAELEAEVERLTEPQRYHWHVCETCNSRWPCITNECTGGTKWGQCRGCAIHDAERYRHVQRFAVQILYDHFGIEAGRNPDEELSAAIDAARKQEKPHE